MELLYPYDIEVYPNVFTLSIADMSKRKMRSFEISERKDQREEMFEYLRNIIRCKGYMVGFNNVGFDYPVLHHLLKNKKATTLDLYNKAQQITSNFEDRFAYIISDKDTLIPQIDLYKIHHFDNKARATSLKMLEFNMRMDNIEELPFQVGSWLKKDDIDKLLEYNRHDVKATVLFLEKSQEELDFRFELSKKYKRNFLNFNDTKIGKDHFVTELEKSQEGSCYYKKDGKRHMRQTKRPSVDLSECILPYVKFERPEFNAILEWFKSQVVYETKGVFTDLPEHRLGDVAKYAKLIEKRKKINADTNVEELKQLHPLGKIVDIPLKNSKKENPYFVWNIVDALNVQINGLEYVFGIGGIHASVESQIIKADDGYIIVDQDVSSYYPNLAIKNRLYPEHLGELFCDIYEGLYNERKKYDKNNPINKMLKLALNGSYGASNDVYSPLYDPKFMMMITINGQLSLCMLAEQLLKIEGLQISQCNTDGLTYRCKAEDNDKAQSICDEWCNITKLELERADYTMMAIANVNNYIAVTTNGKVKTKGVYEWEKLTWNKNHSNIIIGKAVQHYIVDGIPIEETIMNHTNVFDFMARAKVPRSSRLMFTKEDGTQVQVQNICRYYISKSGGSLTKIMPPLAKGKTVWDCENLDGEVERVDTKAKMESRKKKGYKITEVELEPEERKISINAGQRVKPCNNMANFGGFEDIDYDWYINEAKKIATFDIDLSDNDEEVEN